MSRRTRKGPFQGMKTRFVKPRARHGPIKRIVGDTPMKTLHEAEFETLVKDADAVVTFHEEHSAKPDPE